MPITADKSQCCAKFCEVRSNHAFDMICPKCRNEYRPGFTRCSDCNVDLVDQVEEIADESNTAEDDLVSVLETQDSLFLNKLVTKLEIKKIPYLLQSGTAFDWAGLVDEQSDLSWKAALWVPGSRQDEVESLIQKLRTFMAPKQETE
jgi:uncharacterized Zn ribbon protein